MLYRRQVLRIVFNRGFFLPSAIFALAQNTPAAALSSSASSNSAAALPPLILSGRQSDRPAGTYSAGIVEIIKLLDAKLEAPVILAYIQNSPVPYNPDAAELVALKEHGGSTELLLALLHRGDQLRLQLAHIQTTVQYQPGPAAAAAYNYAPEEPGPVYPYGYPDPSGPPDVASDSGDAAGSPGAWWPSVNLSLYRPYRYERGCWYPPHLDGQPPNLEGRLATHGSHPNWVGAAAPATLSQTTRSIFASGGGHPGTPAGHSDGSRGSSHSGGHSGGRSR